jgi:hypothetical protein
VELDQMLTHRKAPLYRSKGESISKQWSRC